MHAGRLPRQNFELKIQHEIFGQVLFIFSRRALLASDLICAIISVVRWQAAADRLLCAFSRQPRRGRRAQRSDARPESIFAILILILIKLVYASCTFLLAFASLRSRSSTGGFNTFTSLRLAARILPSFMTGVSLDFLITHDVRRRL